LLRSLSLTYKQVEALLAQRRLRESADAFATTLHGELLLQSADSSLPLLQHVRLLAETGRCQALRLLATGARLPPDLFRTGRRYALPRPPAVWADPRCLQLALEAQARIVLCSGAFECFTCMLDDQSWEVPLLVRQDGSGQTLAYAGKPMLPPRLSLRAMNLMFYKVCFMECVRAPRLTRSQRAARALLGSDEVRPTAYVTRRPGTHSSH
jgi:hypothetical protein